MNLTTMLLAAVMMRDRWQLGTKVRVDDAGQTA
jgi:hypothetical protein